MGKLNDVLSYVHPACFMHECSVSLVGGKKEKNVVRCHKVSGNALTMCCKWKVRRLFSSLSREMLTFSRLIQHKHGMPRNIIYSIQTMTVYVQWVYRSDAISGFLAIFFFLACSGGSALDQADQGGAS